MIQSSYSLAASKSRSTLSGLLSSVATTGIKPILRSLFSYILYVSCSFHAIYFAIWLFPVPGGPTNNMPFEISMPFSQYSSLLNSWSTIWFILPFKESYPITSTSSKSLADLKRGIRTAAFLRSSSDIKTAARYCASISFLYSEIISSIFLPAFIWAVIFLIPA